MKRLSNPAAATMQSLGVLEARNRFPEPLDRARGGGETLISRHGHPVAAPVPLSLRHRPQRQALLSLRGSGRDCWPETLAQPGGRPGRIQPLNSTASLALDAAVAIDATALIPFLRGETQPRHGPLIAAIAAGHWRGVLSMRTLVSLTPRVALSAARLQRTGSTAASEPEANPGAGLAPDIALELASALHGGATAVISQDPRLLAALRLPSRPPLP